MRGNDPKALPGDGRGSESEITRLEKRRATRRKFLHLGAAATGGLVAAMYVKPDLTSIRVPKAFASGTPAPTPQGCTPGFWKNHTNKWVAYSTADDFDTVFGVDAFDPDKTLYQALRRGGGGVNALGRHAVAALLNAAALGKSSFGLSVAEVISMVQAALAPNGDVRGTKNTFEYYNEASCALGGNKADDDDNHNHNTKDGHTHQHAHSYGTHTHRHRHHDGHHDHHHS